MFIVCGCFSRILFDDKNRTEKCEEYRRRGETGRGRRGGAGGRGAFFISLGSLKHNVLYSTECLRQLGAKSADSPLFDCLVYIYFVCLY